MATSGVSTNLHKVKEQKWMAVNRSASGFYLGFVRLCRLPPVRAVLGATVACLCKNRLSGGSVSVDCQVALGNC